MDQEKLFSVIRGFGYTTSGQTSEIVEAILANSAPNKALVEALQQCLLAFDNIEVPEGGLNGYDSVLHAESVARAALNAAGVGVK